MARYCPNCGTEVDDSAVFCPTCGQPIDQATETEIPAAPAWPESAPGGERDAAREPDRWQAPSAAEAPEAAVEDAWQSRFEEPAPRTEGAPPTDAAPAPPRPAAPVPATRVPPRPQRSAPSLPLTTPVTLSAWLIGGGAVVAALGVLIGLFDGVLNPIDLLLLIVLLAIAATVFFSASVPHVPHLRLMTFAVVLVGFGIALDRIGLGGAGVGELLLFLGSAAAAIGAILLELGRDQPLGGVSA